MSNAGNTRGGGGGTAGGGRGGARTTGTTGATDQATTTAGGPVVGLKADGTPDAVAAQQRTRTSKHPLILATEEAGVEVTFQGERSSRFDSVALDLSDPYDNLVLFRDEPVRVSAETAERIKSDPALKPYKFSFKDAEAQPTEE